MAEPVRKYFRLVPGNEVRLKGAYFVTCTGYEADDEGHIICLHCTYDPASKGGNSPDGRKVKGTLHWVSAVDSIQAEVRLYDRLFRTENPADTDAFEENVNPDSLITLTGCRLEGSLRDAKAGDTFQFMRQGYFCVDPDSTQEHPVFNRTVALNSSWEKKI